MFGAVGITSKSVESASTTAVQTATPSILHQTATPGAAVSDGQTDDSDSQEDRMIDQIGEMAEDSKHEETNIDDISPEERKRQEEMPRNPKKRMFEAEVKRDEL